MNIVSDEQFDPHPYDMPPAERAAYANGYGQGKREAAAEIASLRAELAKSEDWIRILEKTHGINNELSEERRSEAARQDAETISRMKGEITELAEVCGFSEGKMVVTICELRAAARRDTETIARLRAPYRNADDKDWDHLDDRLGHGGHGQFWRAVFREVRAALSTAADPEQQRE